MSQDCAMCNARRECTSGEYTGRCPDEPERVEKRDGKWWANYGDDGPVDSKQEAINFELTH